MLILILAVGLLFLGRLRAIQVRGLGRALRSLRGRESASDELGEVSPFAALMTSVGGMVGSGNIAGVATAITAGGPGALFWMWVSAFLGGGTMFAEGVLGVRYRQRGDDGLSIGGPMLYLRDGLGWRGIAGFYALFMALRIGLSTSTIQSNSIASAVTSETGLPGWVVCVLTALVTGAIVVGGVRQIGRVMEVMAPLMGLIYLGAALVAAVIFIDRIPEAIALIFRHAFTPAAGFGGFAGASVASAVRYGLARGVYSNEAGTGMAAIPHASARTNNPVRQGRIAMLGVFIDTIVICSATGVILVASGVYSSELDSAALTAFAFTEALGSLGGIVVAIASILFGLTTLVTCEFYGEQCAVYVFGSRARKPYRIAFCLAILAGTAASSRAIWAFGDLFSALIAIPNLIALAALSGEVVALLRKSETLTEHPHETLVQA